MKRVVITGISRGIGKSTAEEFLEKGWLVVGTSTSGRVELSHHNVSVFPLRLDDSESVAVFAQQAAAFEGGIDALINSAGVNPGPDQDAFDLEALRQTIAVNLTGTISVTESLLSVMNAEGCIVNISSSAGLLRSIPAVITPYRVSKAGLNMYSFVLAERLQPKNITVVAYNPGWVRTALGSPGATKEPKTVAAEVFALVNNNTKTGTFWDETKPVDWIQ